MEQSKDRKDQLMVFCGKGFNCDTDVTPMSHFNLLTIRYLYHTVTKMSQFFYNKYFFKYEK